MRSPPSGDATAHLEAASLPCVQARLLVDHDPNLSLSQLALVGCLNVLGYVIFRGANSQKDVFRRDPKDPAVSHLKVVRFLPPPAARARSSSAQLLPSGAPMIV